MRLQLEFISISDIEGINYKCLGVFFVFFSSVRCFRKQLDGQFLNVLPRWLLVSLYKFFLPYHEAKYAVNKKQVGFLLNSEKQFLQSQVKQPFCQTRWSPLQNGVVRLI
jgi:hypothetical protein